MLQLRYKGTLVQSLEDITEGIVVFGLIDENNKEIDQITLNDIKAALPSNYLIVDLNLSSDIDVY